MKRDAFFHKILERCNSIEQYLVELLRVRGFLIDEESGIYSLSDNGHTGDGEYLLKLLKKYHLGAVDGNAITIYSGIHVEDFIQEFAENNQIGFPSIMVNKSWKYFKRREHGEKVPVSWLEPFIARYIKAISACCVLTVGSCDGNHPGKNKMFIMTEGKGSIPWHNLICEKCLVDKFAIHWMRDYTAMRFSTKTKYATYSEVNMAAEYLYSHRKEIRKIKHLAFSDIKNSFLKSHTSEDIEREFIGRASELFDESGL